MGTHENHEENGLSIIHLIAMFLFDGNGGKKNTPSLLVLLLKPFPVFRANIAQLEKPTFPCRSKIKLY